MTISRRKDCLEIDPELVALVFAKCQGYRQRMMEVLDEEHNVKVGYSTLTRMTRDMELGKEKTKRACRVPDVPGDEMQHDTSPHKLTIGGIPKVTVIASLLYFRYSKAYYLRFYRSFNRFKMKCFLHEALMHYGYSCPVTIIDNTNLAVLSGTGENAVMVPEMVEFAKRYSFKFKAHRVKKPNRKAGEERGFWTVETNFFPGREFSSLEDLNQKAFIWSTQTMHHKPRTASKIIPAKYFEYEKGFMTQIPEGIPAPCQNLVREIDQNGYVLVHKNHYWTPEGERGEAVVLEYPDHIKIIKGRRIIATYPLPPDGTSNEIYPKDKAHLPFRPEHGVKSYVAEEAELRAAGQGVASYLDYALPKGLSRHRALRRLHGLFRRLSPELFVKVVSRAHRFRVTEIDTLEDIARMMLRDDSEIMPPDLDYDEEYMNRESYREGQTTDCPNLEDYDKRYEGDDEKNDERSAEKGNEGNDKGDDAG